jgi:riboflavin kinase/FMN adenylyltransferase
MELLFNPQKLPDNLVAAIGNFDGVHNGHKKILDTAREIAQAKGAKFAVISFEPHPLHIFRPERVPARITDLRAKADILQGLGVEVLVLLKFNRKFSEISAQDFISRYLSNSHIVSGYNFAFGHKRGGDTKLLQDVLKDNYTMLEPVKHEEVIYSSSEVRKALVEGDIKRANRLLGHNYFVDFKVIHGAGQGAKLGFPTANLKYKPNMIRPKYGVYKVHTNYGPGIANFGVRPTTDGLTELLEVHLFGVNLDLYGKKLKVEFLDYIRGERKFSSVDELKKQIVLDITEVRTR